MLRDLFQDITNKSGEEWVLSAVVVAAVVLLSGWIRGAMLKSAERRQHDFAKIALTRLAPFAPAILIALGLRLLSETVPLEGKVPQILAASGNALLIAVLFWLIRRVALLFVEWAVTRSGVDPALRRDFMPLITHVVSLVILAAGIITLLRQFGFDVFSLMAALGVGTLAVGMAAKDTLANMISGFVVMVDRNLGPGDRVNLGGQIGDVQSIGWRSTRLLMPDGNALIVPNSDLVTNKIINLSSPSRALAANTMIRVPLEVPFERVRAICLDELKHVEGLAASRPGSAQLVSLADGHQLVQLGFWVEDLNDGANATTDINARLQSRLAREGVALLGPPKN